MINILSVSVFDAAYDLLVIPISTDGSISNNFRSGLEVLGVNEAYYAGDYKLGDVKILPLPLENQNNNKFIAFACTVDRYNSAYYAIRLIGRKLAQIVQEFENIKEIVLPLLGTGAGRLNHLLSQRITAASFFEVLKSKDVDLVFCVEDEEIFGLLHDRHYELDTPSGLQVLEAELPNIRFNEQIEKIQYDSNYYFDLAEEKLQQFVSFEGYLVLYWDIEEKFRLSGLTFQQFLDTDLSGQQKEFCVLCGELIAYIDYNAYHKNIWNKYPDKRIIAKSNVRQNIWFLNLIKFKKTTDPYSTSPSIRNALLYLMAPESNLTMLSDRHRHLVIENFFPELHNNKDHSDPFESLFDFFKKKEIIPQNYKNAGVLYSRILYLPFIKPIWNEKDFKGITFEQTSDIDLFSAIQLIGECLVTKAKYLDLGNCGLTDLTVIPELFECTHIEELILSNEWGLRIDGVWRKERSKNNGRKNNIQFLPSEMEKFKNLKTLVCGGDWKDPEREEWNRWGIKNILPITKLEKLEYINLSNCKIENLKGLSKLKNLRVGHLNNNEINSSDSLDGLINLEEIYLSNNRIRKTDFLAKLSNIRTLDIHKNLINDLSPLKEIIGRIGIVNSSWDPDTLNIAKNPLEQPPMAIVNLGTEAVLGLFDDIAKSGRYINKDIKIILVGNSEVGKSTLLKYLNAGIGLGDPHHATVWMDEKVIKSGYNVDAIGEDCELHVFDFGGHDYFHDTHHIFYTTNTIYLLLWDEKSNNLALRKTSQKTRSNQDVEVETQDYPLKYWLDSVKYHTKDVGSNNFEPSISRAVTYNSSLLLIQNKVSQASEIIFQNSKELKTDYPFIYDMVNISIKDPERNMKHFDSLFVEMIEKMEIIGAILPKFYEPIKRSIEGYKGPSILTLKEFCKYCNGIIDDEIDEDQCRRMVGYLEQVGVLLFSEKGLEQKVYVNKRWLIDSMHKILENLTEKNGKFNRNYAAKILGKDDRNIDDILLMMEDFKMVFKHPYIDQYIAPLYLPNIPGGKVSIFLNQNQKPWRRFEYMGYIHKNVILDIFQKFGSRIPREKDSDTYSYWKDGLIIKDINTNEIIMIRFQLKNLKGNACIDVYELAESEQKEFRNEVVRFIKEVNEGIAIDEMVTIDGDAYISKEVLEHNALIGKYIFSEEKLSEEKKEKDAEKLFKLTDYLQFIDNPIRKKKVVVSYSKRDLAHVHTLRRYLKPLIDEEMIDEPWFCTHINPGDDWETKIKHKFDEADIIFFMVSEYFYSTDYIVEKEITAAINRYDLRKDVKIIPIILEFYDWGRKEPFNLQRFCALPLQAKPISDFGNPKMAWSTITAVVKRMIKKDLDPGKIDIVERELEDIYERQVKGLLDKNSIYL